MAHVVLQAASFPSVEAARRAEFELRRLMEAYAAFEASDPDPWRRDRVPPPLLAFGEAHGVVWPLRDDSRFLLKGSFAEMAELLRVDHVLFFWGGGFELGGPTLRTILAKLGATLCTEHCALSIRANDPDARADELASFLDDEDFEDQFQRDEGEASALHTLTILGASESRVLTFDDSGVQDWAFVALLPQLEGEGLELAAR